MTPEQIAARKGRTFAIFGVGIAAMIGAWMFPSSDLSASIISVVFVLVGVTCFVIAGAMTRTINRETGSK